MNLSSSINLIMEDAPDPKRVLKQIREVMPKAGLVYSEKATLTEVLCKPKILPLKSLTLLKLEKMEQELNKE